MALAPELVEELRYVEISVARRIRSLRFGQNRSPLKGSGYEFEAHGKYQVGEDFRRIDWNVTARMQEVFIKRHFEEREVSVFLVADVSRSMRFSTAKHSKNLRLSCRWAPPSVFLLSATAATSAGWRSVIRWKPTSPLARVAPMCGGRLIDFTT